MIKYSFEETRFIKHIWYQHYRELGIAKTLSNFLSSYYFAIIITIIAWLLFIPKVTDNILLIILPFLLVGSTFFLILIDGVYSSFKVLNILDMCRKYVDEDMSLDDLFAVMKV